MGCSKTISVGLNPLGVRTASEQLFTTWFDGNQDTSATKYIGYKDL